MKYEEMNKAQRQRRNGYLQAKQMKKLWKNWRVHGSNCIGKWKRDVRSGT